MRLPTRLQYRMFGASKSNFALLGSGHFNITCPDSRVVTAFPGSAFERYSGVVPNRLTFHIVVKVGGQKQV